MSLTFYHVTWCPECAIVREKLADLGLEYEDVVVPDARLQRQAVYEASGQYYVPVLTDGDVVITDTWEILRHLDEQYANGSREGQG